MIAQNSTSVFLQTILYVVNQSAIQQEDTSSYYYYINNDIQPENKTKCYGSYGCFETAPPWTSVHRPVTLLPEAVTKIEPNYMYYSRENPHTPIHIDLNDFDFMHTVGIDPHIPLFVVTHGFMESGDRPWIKNMVGELLTRQECSVIAVDWHGGSGPPYTQAVANIRLLGTITAHLLADFARHTNGNTLDHVHCIGHSLGAHLSGYTGYALQKDFGLTLGRITGLDPAEPHFSQAQPPVRLDRTAAKFVDIIHTDASAFIRGGLGMTERIGHVDYYPNGGTNQPGCGKSVVQYISAESGSFFRGMRQYLGCNHIRSYEYFSESINSKCPFMSISCNSFQDFKTGKCFQCGKNGQYCLRFGYHSQEHYTSLLKKRIIRPDKNFVQYLMTGDSKPFCKGHYRITVEISNSTESKRHGGEVGQLVFTLHSTRDGKGENSGKIFLGENSFHEPGAKYQAVVPGGVITYLKTVTAEWKYHTSVVNPLTWRILATPRIFIDKVTVESLETRESITVCAKNKNPLLSGMSQLLMSSYCN